MRMVGIVAPSRGCYVLQGVVYEHCGVKEEAGTIRKGSSGKAAGSFSYAVTKKNQHFW